MPEEKRIKTGITLYYSSEMKKYCSNPERKN